MRYGAKENVEIGDKIIDREESYDGRLANRVTLSGDGRWIYYPRNYLSEEYDLFVKPMKRTSEDGTRLDSAVLSHTSLGKDKVLYLKDSGERMLYISDLEGNKTKIDSEVDDFWLSEDKKKLLWKTDHSDDNRLYYMEIESGKDKTKIDSDIIDIVAITDDFSSIYYQKEDVLYEVLGLGDKKKIASGVESCLAVKEDKRVTVYYVTEVVGYHSWLEFVEDEKAQEDAQMEEPNRYDYQINSPFFRGQQQTDQAYYKALEKWEEKEARDQIREYLDDLGKEEYTVYIYSTGKDPIKLASGIKVVEASDDYAGFTYYMFNSENIEKIDISELVGMSDDELGDKIRRSLIEAAELHLNVLGEDVILDIDLEDYSPGQIYCDTKSKTAYISIDDHGLWSDSNQNTEKSLYKTDYVKGKGKLEKVCDGYSEGSVRVVNGILYYICDVDKNGAGSLYADGKKIGSDVSSFTEMEEEKGIIFWTDMNSDSKGTLSFYNGSKVVKVSDDVYRDAVRTNENGELAFLTDYSLKREKGDLKLFRSGKVISVDDDVSGIMYFD